MRNIPIAEPNLGENEKKALLEAFNSGWISSKGKFIQMFEEEFSKFTGIEHCITTSNGTSSLHLILEALGIGQGDEVIVPTFTYIASANVIKYTGATPVFIDIEEDTWNIDPSLIEEKITKKTKAILGVHIYGHSMDLDKISNICASHDIFLIEDAAEAFGTQYKGKHIGQHGIASSFSFFGNKTITTGEGGMVASNDSKLSEKIKIIKNQGVSKKKRYWHDVVGYNYRMTNLQAAIGYAQIRRAHELVLKKRQNATLYSKYLSNKYFQLPIQKDYCNHSYWMYSPLIKEITEVKRDSIMKRLLNEYGIETRPFFIPIHMMPIYREHAQSVYPISEKTYKMGICLPSSTTLHPDEIKYISNIINGILEGET